jgi:hypothetical protein
LENDFTAGVELAGLSPGTGHRWAIRRPDDGTFLGEGTFETAPASEHDAPDEMSFAVLSGHQPFDEQGELDLDRLGLLRAAGRAFDEHRVKRVLMIGGQVHADQPERCSLFDPAWFRSIGPRGRASIFDCSRHEVRQLYQQRYRAFWAMPELRTLMQRRPCYLMIDAHDLAHRFGSRLEHHAAIWRSLREGALDAAFDYQGLRTFARVDPRPPSFHFELEYGPAAVFVMDLRSQRRWVGGRHQIYGDDQHLELARFLDANRRRPVVLLGLAVPLVDLERRASDRGDRWDAPHARASRDRLARLLFEHRQRCPEQRLIVISGGLHAGLAGRLAWRATPPICQLVSSAVSHVSRRELRGLRQRLETGIPGARFELMHRAGMKNPYHGLNIGLVKVLRDGGRWKVKLMLLGLEESSARAKVVFESESI